MELHCICCDKELACVHPEAPHQPHDGIYAISSGHYGSTVFDGLCDIEGELLFHICDDCLMKRAHRTHFYQKDCKSEPVSGAAALGQFSEEH